MNENVLTSVHAVLDVGDALVEVVYNLGVGRVQQLYLLVFECTLELVVQLCRRVQNTLDLERQEALLIF